jgi:hypothetical protein
MVDDGWYPGMVAAQDQYNPDEGAFQYGVRQTPWFSEFKERFGEEPDLNTTDYDTRGAWKAGIRPTTRDPTDGLLHWDSRWKSDTHPNRYVDGIDTKTGLPVDPGESWNPEDEYPYGRAVQKGMQQVEDQFGHLGQPAPPTPKPPPGSMGTLLSPGYQPSSILTQPNDTPEVRSYTPTAREALSQRLQGDAPTPAHRGAVKLLTGSGGLGEGVGALDFLPGGGTVGAQSDAQHGDYQGAAVNLMPGGRAAKGGARALAEGMGEIADLARKAAAKAADPLWSPYSSVKLKEPLDPSGHKYTDQRFPVPKFINPEKLVGGHMLFTPWDRAAGNKTLTHVAGQELDKPVPLHGGPSFPEANPGLGAASEAAISRRIDNEAKKLADKGETVYMGPTTMSHTGVDASHHVAAPVSQLVQRAPITKEHAAEFDAVMQAYRDSIRGKRTKEQVPDWTSINSPHFQDYIANLAGGMTTKTKMAETMAQKYWQDKGFPNIAAIRQAVSEQGLEGLPTDTFGMAISKYIPGQGLIDTTHPSYSKGVAAQHMGQLASLVPFHVVAPTIAAGLAEKNAANKALGKKVAITPAYHFQKPIEGVPLTQKLDDQWLEQFMRHVEAQER